MDDFDTFKAEREKIDPRSRKFSDSQWQESYAAYKSSRKRVRGSRSTDLGLEDASRRRSGSSSRRSSSSGSRKVRPVRNSADGLKHEIRGSSAYQDLRMILDILAWVGIGLLVLSAAIKLLYYTDPAVALASITDAAFQVIVVVVVRLLAHAMIDIPDIALHERLARRAGRKQASESEDFNAE